MYIYPDNNHDHYMGHMSNPMKPHMPLPSMPSSCLSASEVELLMHMRLLWNEHIA